MKQKQQLRCSAIKYQGYVLKELTIWDHGLDPHATKYNVEQIMRALQLNYNMNNFGVESFGLTPDENE